MELRKLLSLKSSEKGGGSVNAAAVSTCDQFQKRLFEDISSCLSFSAPRAIVPLATGCRGIESPRMTPTAQGSFRLFQLWGIHVFLHWSWLVIAFYQIERRKGVYGSIGWNVAEYLTLFLIVLIHEFGHSLATRQVGGHADTIVLWPLGGVAYVSPPPRPGAELWSIAAGPLVNVVFFVLLSITLALPVVGELQLTNPDAYRFIETIWFINTGLLIFNMLPVYPLDGGQILRSLLWFFIGPIRSLYVASFIGFIGVAALAAYAIYSWSIWIGIITIFVFQSCLSGWRQARAMAAHAATPPDSL